MKKFKTRQSGLSVVDLLGGIVLLVVGVAALAGVFLSESRLSRDNLDTALMTDATRSVFATLDAQDFTTLSANYGTGTANPQFWVTTAGDITFTDPGGARISGTIEFFSDESSLPASFAALGGSFDLNGNGSVDGTVTDYKILPTRLTLTVASDDPRNMTVESILYDRPAL